MAIMPAWLGESSHTGHPRPDAPETKTAMSTPCKLHIKIGSAEFLAEGPEATVSEQYRQFLTLVATTGHGGEQARPANNKQGSEGDSWPTRQHKDLGRVFDENADGIIYLRQSLPPDSNPADAIIQILYGFLVLKDKSEVPAGVLMASVSHSGITMNNRLDRLLTQHADFISQVGSKRGSRYRLTNPGIAYAKDSLMLPPD